MKTNEELIDLTKIHEKIGPKTLKRFQVFLKGAYQQGYEDGFVDGENEAWANNYDVEGKYDA